MANSWNGLEIADRMEVGNKVKNIACGVTSPSGRKYYVTYEGPNAQEESLERAKMQLLQVLPKQYLG